MRRGYLWIFVVGVGCGGAVALAPDTAQPQPDSGADSGVDTRADTEEASASDHMLHHFGTVAEARDAVIRGDVAGIVAPMGRLERGEYGIEIPQQWIIPLTELQSAARRGMRAKTLREAGQVVGMVSRQCGECHGTFGRPAHIAETGAYAARGQGVAEVMARHKWAAEQMWLGLTTPSHEAWIRGSEAISERWTPPAPAVDAGQADASVAAGSQATVDPSVQRLIGDVRALGPQLREAQTSHARAKAYGYLIARCGACHVASGVRF